MAKILILNPAFYGVENFCRAARWFARSRGRVQRHPDYLAIATAVLEEDGNECKLIDAACLETPFEQIKKTAEKFKPDMIVTHTTTPSIYNDIKQAADLKESTNALTVLIGAHVSALPINSLKINKKIDVIARKEFDYTLRDLVKVTEGKENLENILGITYRENDKIKQTEERPFIENLDEMPFPAWHHINVHDYFDAGKLFPFITMITGRGCPNRCSFCILPQVLYGRQYRLRSAKKVVDEIEYDLKMFPDLKEFMFEDDTLTVDRQRCRLICEEILDRGLDVTWSGNSRADITDLDLLKLMKKAGCRMFVVGFEFGCQEILNQIKKGITTHQMKKFSNACHKAGIKIHGCFMIGGPGETKETAKMTIKLAKDLKCDTLQFSALTPYPGTEFYEWCEKNNFITARNWEEWVDAGEQSTVVSYPNLNKKEIIELVDKGLYESFYFRPSIWIHHLVTTRNIPDLKRKIKGFLSLVDYKIKRKRKY
jgi:radical SAM superfamily enzyme YgiQ (UPF0313 family)